MLQYLIVCRSLTYAQRAAKLLERSGITAVIARAPAEATGTGCGYCVKISEKRLADSLRILRQAGFPASKILLRQENGSFSEVQKP